MEQEIISIGALGLAALAGGIVQTMKDAGLPNRYAGLASLVIGTLLGLAAFLLIGGVSLGIALFEGAKAGLMAAGVYSGVKALRAKK